MDSIAGVVGRIRRGELSVVEAVSASLRRLDELADHGAVAFREDEAVFDQARALDNAIKRGEAHGALLGLPVTVKDWIDVAGFPCAGGDPANRERRPERDASAVMRLREAGAVVIAKTNVNSSYGVARSVWDSARTPGRSSSGGAVAVSGGAVLVDLASDSGGSLRFPAHCSGLVTIKPTLGMVPATGHFPPIDVLTDGRTVIGPLCRTVEDALTVLNIIAGPDGIDPSVPPIAPTTSTGRLRVAVHSDSDVGPSSDVSTMIGRVVDCIAENHDVVGSMNVLHPTEALDLTQRYWDRPLATGEETERLLSDWHSFRLQGMQHFDTADLIVSPAAPYPAPLIGEESDNDWAYTLAPSMWGAPAAVVPCGLSQGGLPLGVQIVAPPWHDARTLRLAEVLQNRFTIELTPFPNRP